MSAGEEKQDNVQVQQEDHVSNLTNIALLFVA